VESTEPIAKVKLTYFKESGKYYSNGEYETKQQMMYDVYEEVRQMQKDGKLPGLVDGGGKEFTVLVEIPDHPCGCPQLIFPSRS
jgi:hypothetical protein